MAYCKHCEKYLPDRITNHFCVVKGQLTNGIHKFLVNELPEQKPKKYEQEHKTFETWLL